jgi:hypothetical protein
MKKFLTIMLASMIIFAMTAPAMAMHFDMSGKLRVRSFVLGNYVNGDSSSEFVDQRLRIKGTWGIVENVSLTFRADVLEGFWGDRLGALGEQVATDPITTDLILQSGIFQELQTKEQIAFDWVYGSFVLPSTGTALHIGRQGVNWGTKMAVAADNRDRLKIIQPAGGVKLGFVYDKFRENFVLNSVNPNIQDSSGTGILALGDLGGFKSGIIYYYVSNKSLPMIDTQTSNVDVFTMGTVGKMNLKAELNYVWGDRKTENLKVDLEGLAAYVGLGFNAGMADLGIDFGYARGNDPNSAKNEGAASHDYDSPFYSIVLYNNLDYDGFQSNKAADRGVTNAIALKAYATAKPSEKLSLTGAILWAQQDEKAVVGTTNGLDKDLGWELDGYLSYNIYDNVAYTLGIGYLFAGDAFNTAAGEIDDPWAMMNRIQIHF